VGPGVHLEPAMRGRFSKHWTDEIAEISTLPEFQNSSIEILDPSIEGEYDIYTGEWTYPSGTRTIYTGRARIKAIRWGVTYGGEGQANAKTVTAIRVQVPKEAVGKVLKGAAVTVTASDDNDSLEGTRFVVTSGFQGSAQASRTFEASVDGDAEPDE